MIQPYNPTGGPAVAVIGGGFSGLLTTLHLLTVAPQLTVRLVERAPTFGRGRAYATAHPDHLLNVRASNMSAYPDRPDHFLDWLRAQGQELSDGFVSRGRYGDYLQHLLREAVVRPGRAGRLLLEADTAVAVRPAPAGYEVELALGRSFPAGMVVLALGSLPARPPAVASAAALASPAYFAEPWAVDLAEFPPGDVLLLGSGLTMVDVALSLAAEDRPMTALSRRGLLPRIHSNAPPIPPPSGLPASPRRAMRILRDYAAATSWRQAVDSIRPATAGIWRSWSLDQRRQFLRGARPWWDAHRHRMAPVIGARVSSLLASGALSVEAGRLAVLEPDGDGLVAEFRRRGEAQILRRRFAAVVNCTGPTGELSSDPTGLLPSLLGQGLIAPDALRLGYALDERLRLLGRDGRPTPGLYAVGPLTRAATWESVAIPDLRAQAQAVAASVATALGDSIS
jgi:uncharacterized NAD(P)/FAD-binding protein YdhS